MPRLSFEAFRAQTGATGSSPGRQVGSADRSATTGLRFRQEAIIDFMLLNPAATNIRVAQHFGFSLAHLSTLMRSDAFTRELAARRASIRQRVEETTIERLRGLANASIANMHKQVTEDPAVPLAEVRETCSMALQFMGYSTNSVAANGREGSGPVQINIISSEDLALARERIRGRNGAPSHTIDADPAVDAA